MSANCSFATLPVECFMHPQDIENLEAFRHTKTIAWLIPVIRRLGYEKTLLRIARESGIVASSDLFPEIHDLIEVRASACGVSTPEMVLNNFSDSIILESSHPHSILLHNELLNRLSKEQLDAYLTTCLVHIRCLHLPYLVLEHCLRHIGPQIGIASALFLRLRGRLECWRRWAYASADRGASLILSDAEPVLSMLQALAGPCECWGGCSSEQFRQHALVVYGASADKPAAFGLSLQNENFPLLSAWRAGALLDWIESDDYQKCREGRFESSEEEAIPLWGQFASDAHCWGEDQSEEDPAPFAEAFAEEVRKAADHAGSFAQEGIAALTKGAFSFFETVRSELTRPTDRQP